jgi:hypothetical protein
VLALVLLLAAAAPRTSPAADPISPGAAARSLAWDGSVVTPDGIRFRLPPRLSYAIRVERGRAAWMAIGEGASILAAFPSDAGLPCAAEVSGVELEPFTTERGLRGCIGSVQGDDSARAFALARVTVGETLLEVTALAPGDAAERLARLVADSIEAGPLDLLPDDVDDRSADDEAGSDATAEEGEDAASGDDEPYSPSPRIR